MRSGVLLRSPSTNSLRGRAVLLTAPPTSSTEGVALSEAQARCLAGEGAVRLRPFPSVGRRFEVAQAVLEQVAPAPAPTAALKSCRVRWAVFSASIALRVVNDVSSVTGASSSGVLLLVLRRASTLVRNMFARSRVYGGGARQSPGSSGRGGGYVPGAVPGCIVSETNNPVP